MHMTPPRGLAVLVVLPALAVHAAPAPPPSAAAEAKAKAIVTELVACGTRHSLSAWDDPRRGIGCGRDAVVRRFQEIAAKSGGRLQMVVDKYEASGPRTG